MLFPEFVRCCILLIPVSLPEFSRKRSRYLDRLIGEAAQQALELLRTRLASFSAPSHVLSVPMAGIISYPSVSNTGYSTMPENPVSRVVQPVVFAYGFYRPASSGIAGAVC
jgi:hypothetical protein